MATEEFLFRGDVDGRIWSSVLSRTGDQLVFDVRKEDGEQVSYVMLDLDSMKLHDFGPFETTKWSNLEGYDDALFVSEYLDRGDPSQKKYLRLESDGAVEISVDEIPVPVKKILLPHVYDLDSEHFRTVQSFLGLEIQCAAEYLEFDRKIIMSYYLRSDKKFDRFLLVLEDGNKVFKVVQDSQMNGFAAGAFFVLDQKLVFVKNSNEIHIYPI